MDYVDQVRSRFVIFQARKRGIGITSRITLMKTIRQSRVKFELCLPILSGAILNARDATPIKVSSRKQSSNWPFWN
jgi:hypothetical protein